MPRIALCKASEVHPQRIKQVVVDDAAPIALYNLDGCIYATADTCTHGAASLADGDIEGDEVVCPFHLGAFDIRSGEATRPPCIEALRTYAVTVDDDTVYIDLEP
jgi:nitrite reductase/ring-hydroxylating ferredoxin subunit